MKDQHVAVSVVIATNNNQKKTTKKNQRVFHNQEVNKRYCLRFQLNFVRYFLYFNHVPGPGFPA